MEVAEIVKQFKHCEGTYPTQAVEAALAAQAEITPALLDVLADTVSRAEEILEEDVERSYMAHLYAMYLLAQFRDTRAYPLVIRYMRLESRLIEGLSDDFITSDLYRVVASVCDGDLRPIKAVIEDANLNEYARSAGLHAIQLLVLNGSVPRDEAMAYFKSLFEGGLERSYSHVWDSLVDCALSLHPGEVKDHIAAAYQENLVAQWFISPGDIEETLEEAKENVIENSRKREKGFITDVVREMMWWTCFKEGAFLVEPAKSPEPSPVGYDYDYVAPAAKSPKIGPNEPCPCGSGKKYKKCCGRVA